MRKGASRRELWKYSKESERTFFFYATVAMIILGAFLKLFGG